MKIALGTHSMIGYPPVIKQIPSSKRRKCIFKWAQKKGFDGIDVGDWWFDFYTAEFSEVEKLKNELLEHDLELAGFNCLRKCVTHPSVKERNQDDLRRAIEVAKIVRPAVVSISLSLDPDADSINKQQNDELSMSPTGLSVSPGSSIQAMDEEFHEAAEFLAELAEDAESADVGVALELHHCSIADTSQSVSKILSIANHPNLSANPDLGNLYWAYNCPLEPWHEAVERLAGRINFWHVKNLHRVYIPEIKRSFFIQAPLDEGDIDYRWALEKFVSKGFNGYISLEGAGPGDLFAFATRGKIYLDELISDINSDTGIGCMT